MNLTITAVQLLAGLSQPILLEGYNLELNILTEKLILEYSHGWNLNLAAHSKFTQTDQENSQKLSLRLPYSTGGGVGYRFTEEFNLRLELKQHKYVVKESNGNQFSYLTRDIGVGAYYQWNPWQNVLIVPSIRYWPTIWTSLAGDTQTLSDGQSHQAHEFGLFGNVSVGLAF